MPLLPFWGKNVSVMYACIKCWSFNHEVIFLLQALGSPEVPWERTWQSEVEGSWFNDHLRAL
jgi:hypothetical protein